jgi:DNA-binding SARP family transcriptional activator
VARASMLEREVGFMEFRILGPLDVIGEAGAIDVGGRKPRALLALLLVRANWVVAADRLIDDLWDGAPPSSALTTLQTYVSQLRKLGVTSLRTRPPGYVLEVDPDALDATRFERVMAEVVEHDDDPGWVAARLGAALGWWRGPALVDFADSAWAQLEATRLESLRLDALGDLFDARLALGQHRALVSKLETLVASHAFYERFWSQLMLALYRSDRQADALRAYQQIRRHLGEELGIAPSVELVRLEEAILLQKPELEWHPAPAPSQLGRGSGKTRDASPTGILTFFLTDVVGSTALWHAHPHAMPEAVARHDALVAEVVGSNGGELLKHRGEGDSTFSIFGRATEAAAAAILLQNALDGEPWTGPAVLKVRIALHTGEAIERDGDYYGTTVNRAARLRELAHGGQILCSQSTAELVREALPGNVRLVELGTQTLRGLPRPEVVFSLDSADTGTPSAAGPRLEVSQDDAVEIIPLLGERLTIGRSRANDVALVSDHATSRIHALLERVASGWCVRDLGSRNGTFLNRQRIDVPLALRDADIITIGTWRAVFRDDTDDDSGVTTY